MFCALQVNVLKAINFLIFLLFTIFKNQNDLINLVMGILKQVAEYLYLRKKDPNAPNTQWVKYMHGINRLSIILFLLAMIFIVVKLIVRN